MPDPAGFFTSYNHDGRLISYYGDNHPPYAGNVVKAMASAKHGYPHVVALFAGEVAADPARQPQRDAALGPAHRDARRRSCWPGSSASSA